MPVLLRMLLVLPRFEQCGTYIPYSFFLSVCQNLYLVAVFFKGARAKSSLVLHNRVGISDGLSRHGMSHVLWPELVVAVFFKGRHTKSRLILHKSRDQRRALSLIIMLEKLGALFV